MRFEASCVATFEARFISSQKSSFQKRNFQRNILRWRILLHFDINLTFHCHPISTVSISRRLRNSRKILRRNQILVDNVLGWSASSSNATISFSSYSDHECDTENLLREKQTQRNNERIRKQLRSELTHLVIKLQVYRLQFFIWSRHQRVFFSFLNCFSLTIGCRRDNKNGPTLQWRWLFNHSNQVLCSVESWNCKSKNLFI